MNLSDLLDETTTGADLPSSRLVVEDVYRAGLRRRRVGLAARAALVVVPIVALVVGLVTVVRPMKDTETADPPPTPATVYAVGGFTGQRLWAYVESCAGCGFQLRTTDDGGRTWTALVVDPAERAQVTMATAAGGLALMRHPASVRVGLNGWGVLRNVDYSPVPVGAAPLDAPVHCVSGRYRSAQGERDWTDPGTVRIVDIPGTRYGPTPTQPPFPCQAAVRAPDGVVLAAGRDPGTGRPAVARSLDNGSTWTTTVLEPELPDGDLIVGDLLGSAGGAAAVTFRQGPWSGTYRYDAGAWSRLFLPGRQPDHLVLTRDGTLVAEFLHGVTPRPPDSPRQSPTLVAVPAGAAAFVVNRPGALSFQPVSRPKGIGREAVLGYASLPGGGHVAFNNSRVWTSADGTVWKALKLG